VSTLGTVPGTPTAFAFDAQWTFIAVGPGEESGSPGGLWVTDGAGAPTQVPGVQGPLWGAVWHGDTLYVSSEAGISALSGWNGSNFATSKMIRKGSGKAFSSFTGLAFGPDGRLYTGVSFTDKTEFKRIPGSLNMSVVSMRPDGSGFHRIARGLRQPWQMTFVGDRGPFVSVLAQDKGKIPLDAIVLARRGQDYGYPVCAPVTKRRCPNRARPIIRLPKHASPMGINAVGNTLYVALFGGTGKGPEVVSIPARRGGKPTPVLTGYAAPVVALGINQGNLFTGDVTGAVYKVAL
jgi:glucose/arabinose dehydrogenase